MEGLKLPWEVADGIALAVMQDHLQMIEEDIEQHVSHGKWMHPEDYHVNVTEYIPALNTLIKYFGGLK